MKRIIALTLVFLMFIYLPASATTIKVPDDYLTIQTALLVALEGDTVLVAPGIYNENIIWPTTNGIKLISQHGQGSTIINGMQQASVIRFSLGTAIDTSTVIDGFVITNGYAHGIGPKDKGSGIYCINSSPSLKNVTISENVATIDGGGIFLSYSSPNLVNVTISANTANDNGAGISCYDSSPSLVNVNITRNVTNGDGGGIYCYDSSPSLDSVRIIENESIYNDGGGIFCVSSSLSLVNVTISGNVADDFGGGIACRLQPSASFLDATITGNRAGSGGGGISCYDSSPSLLDVTISGNVAGYGGGIRCYYYSSPTLVNVTITGNTVGSGGSGLRCRDRCSPTLVNVTISENNSAVWGGGIEIRDNSHLILVNSILWNDSPQEIYPSTDTVNVVYSDIQGGWIGTGNIDTDPLFLGNGNYQLQQDSPCIDAGIAFYVYNGDTLINLYPWQYNGSAPDMGAYELDPAVNIEKDKFFPKRFVLNQNYPNPFNPETTISFDIPENRSDFVNVNLSVYNMLGQKIITLINEPLAANSYEVKWYGNDSDGQFVPTGMYFYLLKTENFISSHKMMLIK